MMKKNYFILIVLLAFPSLVSGADDLIYLIGKKKPIVAFITKENDKQISFKDVSTNAKQKVDVSKINKVIYKDASKAFKAGMDALKSKNYSYAIRKFLDAKKTQKKSRGNWHKYYIPWYLYFSSYKAFLESNDSKTGVKVVKGLHKFIEKYAKNRFSERAELLIADVNLRLKKFKEAKKLYEKLVKKSKNSSIKNDAYFGLVNIYKEEGNFTKAIKLGEEVIKKNQASPVLLQIMAQMLVVKKQYKKGKLLAESILAKKIPSALKGAAYELKGISETYLNKNKQALNDLLMAELLYPSSIQKTGSLNTYLAININVLMQKNMEQFPNWEYQNHYQRYYGTLNSKQRKLVKNFKI